MLPNNAIIDEKIYESSTESGTKTLQTEEKVDYSTSAILGKGVLGKMILGKTDGDGMVFRLTGAIDGIDALKQSIAMRLSTEADQYIIYPYTYGITTLDLYGMPFYYIMAVLPKRIIDALKEDDRITKVSNFSFKTLGKNKLHTTFTVHSIYGDVTSEMTVSY